MSPTPKKTMEIRKQPRVKIFNLKSNLTGNIFMYGKLVN